MFCLNLLLIVTFVLIVRPSLQDGEFSCNNKAPYSCTFKSVTKDVDITNKLDTFYNGYYQFIDPTTAAYVTIYLAHINNINFESSHFASIPRSLFVRLAIPNVDLTGVGLEAIKKEDFSTTESLKTLNLSNNNLTYLSNIVFSNMKSLISLNLSRNQIESFHDGAFDECSRNLKTIDLSYNKLLTIKEDFFINLQDTVTGMLNLVLDFNDISAIESSKKDEKIRYKLLSLESNKLKDFDCKKYEVDRLYLDNNNLESFDSESCDVKSLYIGGNHLKVITIAENLVNLDASNNEIKSVKFKNNCIIESLKLSRNAIADNVLESLKDVTTLRVLDLSDIFIGPLPIDAFSKMISLESLSLKNSAISNINFGTFSHQRNLTHLDISSNNLKSLNLHMFTALNKLTTFDLSGNNLSALSNMETMKVTFPLLLDISIHDNNWNCSYLAIFVNNLNANRINVQMPEKAVTKSSHISGIGCKEDSNVKIDLLPRNENEISEKLNELITKFNQENTTDLKREVETMKVEIYKTKNDYLHIKSELIKQQLSSLNSSSTVTITSDIRFMVEHFNNMTIEKQILSSKMLSQQIDKLHFEIEKLRAEKYETTSSRLSALKATQSSSNTDNNNHKFVEIMLVIILTAICILGIFKTLKYFKSNYGPSSRMMNINKSQSTLHTTFDNNNL